MATIFTKKNALWLLFRSIHLCFVILWFVTEPFFKFIYEKDRTKVLPPITDKILLTSAVDLAKMIRERKVTAVDVVKTHVKRILCTNCILNAVVDRRYEEAIAEAKEIDDILDSANIPPGYSVEEKPLLGVPFTAKVAFAVTGMKNDSGLLSRQDHVSSSDAPTVANMRKAGAIPIALTNCSELCMWYESSNLVHGRTNNAYHPGRIVGGSSGGEGCMLAAGGSVMGIGSDIGGSIRMPSFFNGVFGHKPTVGVISNEGQYPCSKGKSRDYLTTGPMCRYATDLMPMFKAMAGKDVAKVKLDAKVDIKKLKCYYMDSDGDSHLVSPVDQQIKDSIKKAATHFAEIGVIVQRINIREMIHSVFIWTALMGSSGDDSFSLLMGGEQQEVWVIYEFLRWLVGAGRHTLPAMMLGFGEKVPMSETDVIKMTEKCEALKTKFKDMLGSDGFFLYPTHPRPAPYHNQPILMPFNFGYTGIFNVLGLPVTAVPMGLCQEGVPIGLQVVANFFHDHISMAVAVELEKAFGGWVSPSQIST